VALLLAALCLLAFAPGCMIMEIGVTNPVPGLSTVAVAPFINLSHERAVDGRRFALAYYSELQKVPGFEVVPVGVTEAVIVENNLQINSPDDVLKLARLLNVDAVVVGAVTDYAPYYPPRVGMQVEWYSPHPVAFYPGIQVEPQTREQLRDWDEEQVKEWRKRQKELDHERAPQYHIWHRCWWKIKKLPGIRKLAGEPAMVHLLAEPDAVVRAQSMDDMPRALANGRLDLSTRVPAGSNASFGWIQPAGVVRANAPLGVAGLVIHAVTETAVEPPPSLPITTPPAAAPPVELPQPLETTPLVPANPPSTEGAPNATPNSPPANVPAVPQAPSLDSAPAFQPPPHKGGAVPEQQQDSLPQEEPDEPLPRMPNPSEAPRELQGTLPAPILPIRDPNLAPLPPQPNPYNVVQPIQPWQLDPRQPFMSYTRLFDGSDANLVAALRDYVELSGDLRSGGWEAYMHRSEDFIRFTSHLMIVEMLSLHGGEGKHRIVIKHRKYK